MKQEVQNLQTPWEGSNTIMLESALNIFIYLSCVSCLAMCPVSPPFDSSFALT